MKHIKPCNRNIKMFLRTFFRIYILAFFISCAPHQWALINTIPMYNNIEKPADIVAIDKQFILEQTARCGSVDSASREFAGLGWYYLMTKQEKTAIRRFNQAWLLDSTNAESFFGFAAYTEITDPKSKQINKYVRMGKKRDKDGRTEEDYRLLLARTLIANGRYQRCIELCDLAISSSSENKTAYAWRGKAWLSLKDYKKAYEDLVYATKLGFSNSYHFNDLGYSCEMIGKTDKAFEYYKTSMELDSTFINPIYNTALLHKKLGNMKEALEYVEKCISMKPDHAQFKRTKKEILASMENE
jgi:tetratricopeptide (TPR) repeat protein